MIQKKEDWSVSILCFFVLFFFAGMERSSSIFFVQFIQIFNITREVASIPFTAYFLLLDLVGPVAGCIAQRFMPSTILLTVCFFGALGIVLNFLAQNIFTVMVFWGICQGIAYGMIISLVPLVLNDSFEKYFSTAVGVTYSGISVGGSVLPILNNLLIQTFNASGALLVVGGLTFHTVPLMFLLYNKANRYKRYPQTKNGESFQINVISGNKVGNFPEQVVQNGDSETDESFSSVCIRRNNSPFEPEVIPTFHTQQKSVPRNPETSFWYLFLVFSDPTFLVILVVKGFYVGIVTFVHTMLADLLLEKEVPVGDEIYILSLISIAGIIGYVGIGRINDSGIISVVNLIISCLMSMMMCFLSLIWCRGFIACLIPSLVYGIAFSGIIIAMISCIKEYALKEFLNMSLASSNILCVPISLTIPSIIGIFKDRMGSYDGLLCIFSGTCIICSIMTFSVPYLARRRDKIQSKAEKQAEIIVSSL